MRLRVADFVPGGRLPPVDDRVVDHFAGAVDEVQENALLWTGNAEQAARNALAGFQSIALYGWAETFRATLSNPAIGLPQSLGSAFDATLDWASDSQNYSISWETADPAEYIALGVKTASFIKRLGESFEVDWAAMIADLSNTAWGKSVASLGQAVPFVGWAVQGLMAGMSLADEIARLDAEATKQARTAVMSGLSAISSSGDIFAVDRAVSNLVRSKTTSGIQNPGGGSWTSDDIDLLAAGGPSQRNLTAAFLPGPIPGTGGPTFVGAKESVPNSGQFLILGKQDDSDSPYVLSSRMSGLSEAQGVGYVPGLQRLVGYEQIEQHGSRPARTRDIGNALSGTLSLLKQMEALVTGGPPWCYLVDTEAVLDAWQDCIEGYIELRQDLYISANSPSDRRFPGYYGDGNKVNVVDSDPGWWMTVSEVTRPVRQPNGNVELRRVLVPGPKLMPQGRDTAHLPYNAGPAAMTSPAVLGPLDYYAHWASRDLAANFSIDSGHPAEHVAIDAYGDGYSGSTMRFSRDRVFESLNGPGSVGPECKGENRFSGPTRKFRTRLSPFETEARTPCPRILQYRYSGQTVAGEPFSWGGWDPNRVWPIPFGAPVVWTDHAGQMSARVDGSPTQVITGNILEMVIRPWCNRLFSIQKQYLDTLWCGYVHPGYPAFAGSPGLRLLLLQRRAQLLNSPAKFKLNTADVVDNIGPGSYAEALKKRGVCMPSKFISCDTQKFAQDTNQKWAAGDLEVNLYTPEPPPPPAPPALPEPVPQGDDAAPDEPDPKLSTEPKQRNGSVAAVGIAAVAAIAAVASQKQ